MTTASRSTEARLRHVLKLLATLLPILRAKAEELAPRPNYLVEPVIETHTWVDPADGEAKEEVVYIIADGTRDEWRDYSDAMADTLWEMFASDDELRELVAVSIVNLAEMNAWRSIDKRIYV